MRRITFDRARMIAGEPGVIIDNGAKIWRGFDSARGVIFLKAEDGKAWLEFHGDDEDLREGGIVHKPTSRELDTVLLNMFPKGMAQRLKDDPTLVFGAVNRPRVQGKRTAVTLHMSEGSALVPMARFEGHVWSSVVIPPIVGPPEPLNFWIETNDRNLVEF